MTNTWLRRRLTGSGLPSVRGGRRKAGYRPRCEHLEQREVPTVSWVGLGDADGAGLRNWLDLLNWREVIPGGLGNFRLPQINETLIFGNDSAADARATHNGFPTDFPFGGITFNAPGYSVAANSATSPSNRFILGGTLVSGAAGITPVDADIRIDANRSVNVATGTLQLRGAISGAGGLNKGFPGVLELGGATGNSFTGGVTVGGGTLLLNKTAGNAVSGNGLTISNATGLETVRLLQDNQIADNARVVVGGACLLDLNNHVETFGPLGIIGGRVQIGTGTLSVQGAITTSASGAEAQITGTGTGTLALRPVVGNQQTINVAQGAAPFDLVITARLASGVAGTGLNKIGAGSLALRGPGTYDGPTAVSAGRLFIFDNTALGAASAGTNVVSGAFLELENGLTVAEPLSLSGTGIGGQGALGAAFGTITLTGSVALGSTTSINVFTGTTLIIRGVINDGLGTFGITKIGLGTLTLPAGTSHGYDGGTIVSAGTLQLDGTITSLVTVNSGGTLTGRGLIDPAGPQALTVNANGVVSPGVDGVNNGIGTLSADGDVDFNGPARFRVQVSSAGGDSLRVLGASRTVNLNPNVTGALPILERTALDPIAGGTEFRIVELVDSTSIITGRFAGLSGNPSPLTINGQAFFLGYTAGPAFNDFVLQRNVAPMVEFIFLYPEEIVAGDFVYLIGQLTDSDPDDFQFLYVNWGDGTEEIHLPGLELFAVWHQYTEPGEYPVIAFWFDLAGEGNFRVLPLVVHPGGAPGRAGQPAAPADAVRGLLGAAPAHVATPAAEPRRLDEPRGAVAAEATGISPRAWDALPAPAEHGGRSVRDLVFAADTVFAEDVLADVAW